MKIRLSDNHVRVRLDRSDEQAIKSDGFVSCTLRISPRKEFSVTLTAGDEEPDTPSLTFRDTGMELFVSRKEIEALFDGNTTSIFRDASSERCGIVVEIDIQ